MTSAAGYRRSGVVAACIIACLSAVAAHAQDVRVNGLADLRLVAPSGEDSNFAGGLGKLRWGSNDPTPVAPELGGLYLRGTAQLAPDVLAAVELRSNAQQQTAVNLLDAFLRWRPVSITRWRWAVQAGAFFPPVSLENTDIGWTSPWNLTPSAINTWVGDELRVLGGEATLEWRGDVDHFVATFGVFGWNQPAGVAIAGRGWTFDDSPTGVLARLRLPEVEAEELAPPGQPYGALYADEFRQITGTPGWYAGISWQRPDLGRVALLRYDNMADPAAHDGGVFAWHTRFWSLGVSSRIGAIIVLAQAMIGSTTIAPAPTFASTTDFWAGYVLAGYVRGAWRYAVRLEDFATGENSTGGGPRNSEHGAAVTADVTWTVRSWLRLTAEVLAVDYNRPQRQEAGLPPHAVETQAQLAVRLSF